MPILEGITTLILAKLEVFRSRLSIEITQNQQKMTERQVEKTPVIGFVMEEEEIEEE